MSEFIRQSEPIARKKHRCDLCGGNIEKSTKYLSQTVSDGELYTFKMHLHCNELITLLDIDDYGDGIEYNIFHEALSDYAGDKEIEYNSTHELSEKVYGLLSKSPKD